MESTSTFTNSFFQGLGFGTGIIVAAGTAIFVMGNALLFYKDSKNENEKNREKESYKKEISKESYEMRENNVFKQMFDDLE